MIFGHFLISFIMSLTNRSERSSDQLWQKTLITMAVRKEIWLAPFVGYDLMSYLNDIVTVTVTGNYLAW